MNNVVRLPVFKVGATAAERFFDLARRAEENPELYDKVVVISVSNKDYDGPAIRHSCVSCSYTEALGVLQLGLNSLLDDLRD